MEQPHYLKRAEFLHADPFCEHARNIQHGFDIGIGLMMKLGAYLYSHCHGRSRSLFIECKAFFVKVIFEMTFSSERLRQ